ncbi:3'(2'),5'-bisphosphate nucleotidase CysQ [Rhizobium sp. TRM95111]|uniref:3'(2'),5'-bisphosphate nucleotidase CysQ n=1 Tax=Rhizobium alarense TaxID=2846851 RepID=UPI001F3BD5EE|nr:3'(2'),5'-bisphosphate nucleotidase CysQ [Rhizobium alarense]MCF3640944.1 3'(2'),5'-bisphosphate nucleotidase CysQ [Rhizobium alarense]
MKDLIETFEEAAIAAGKAILEVYESGPNVALKDDQSPVTEADERAEAIILRLLAERFPEIPVVAEESVAAGRVPTIGTGPFFLVDPLDGTKEFINRRNDFTVNIALIENGAPVAGIVYAPARGVAYTASRGRAFKFEVTSGFAIANRTPITCRRRPASMTAVASRSHNSPETLAFLERHGVTDCTSVGSSLKFCLVAEGTADVYPRFGRTMEWDTAAGDAILRAAGGQVTTVDGRPFVYGKVDQKSDSDFANMNFIGWGSAEDQSAS